MKAQKYYRVLYLYDHLKGGELVNSLNTDYFTPRDPGLSFAQTH